MPDWVRPGATLEYLATDGMYYDAKVVFVTDEFVTIELADTSHHEVTLKDIGYEKHFRHAKKHVVTVAREPMINCNKVGNS